MDILFKQLVDSTKRSFDLSLLEELPKLYRHYNLEYEDGLIFHKIEDYLYKIIQDSLIGDQLYKSQLFTLKDQLLLSHYIKDNQLQPYLGILKIIIDATRLNDLDKPITKLVSFEDDDKWCKAIQLAWDLATINPKLIEHDLQNTERSYKRLFEIGQAAKYLQYQGCNINIKDGRIIVEESQEEKIANQIENDIKLLGGIEALRRLFKIIEPCYNINQDRYHLGVTLTSVPKFYSPLIPISYLLNLCVKHPKRKILIAIENPDNTWIRILRNTVALTSASGVQPHNQFALYFQAPDTIVRFLQDLAVYDNLFCPNQLRPSDVPKVIRGLFSWLSDATYQILGWTPEQAAIVAEEILKLAKNKLYPITFQAKQLYESISKIEKDIIDTILTIYSHEVDSINCDFQNKPLIKLNNNEYLLISASICSPAFYESVTSEVRAKIDSKIDGKLGEKIEYFIKDEFSKRGIKFNCGKYGTPKKGMSPDEIDILVETTDTLIFFEIKKKPLTKTAKTGSNLELFIDLSESLLKSQSQINKHEIYIRKNGNIPLENGSICYLNNRSIARVSVTLLDFGSFQDRSIIFQFLENMLSIELKLTDQTIQSESLNKKIEDLNENLRKFQHQFNELVQLDSQRINNPFYECWFLSVPQLLIILDNVNSSDDLKRELWRTRSISTSSLDFYKEYEYIRSLNI